MAQVVRRLKPNVVFPHPIITNVRISSLLTAILKMQLTTRSDLRPPTHPPTVMLEGVTAGHLHIHMNNCGLLSAFLSLRPIYKSACTVFWSAHFSVFMDIVHICVSTYFGRFTMHMLADHKLVQSTSTNGISVWMVCWFIKFKINYEATSNSPLARLSTTTGSSLSSSEASRWDSRIKQARYKMLISDL